MHKFLFLGLFLLLWLPVSSTGQARVNDGQTLAVREQSTRSIEDPLQRHLGAAQTYQLSGDLNQAAIENRTVIAIALSRLGAIAIRERNFAEAVRLLNDSLSGRDDTNTHADLAIAYMRLLEIDKAVEQARLAIALDEKNSRAHHLLGKLFYMKADYAGALSALERAVVLHPDLDAAYTLGMTYLRLKQIERAKLLFEEMQSALSKSAHAHLLFGRAFEETGFSTEAEKEFRKAIAVDDKAPRAHFYLGYVILQHGGSERLHEAREEFERELKSDPQSIYANFFLGVLASTENEHAKAITNLQEATRLSPQFGEAYLFLGQSQAELGHPDAEKNLRRAIELTSDVAHNSYQIKKAHFVLGRLLLKSGRQAEAEKELAKARDLQGKSLETSRQEISSILSDVQKTAGVTAASEIAASKPTEAGAGTVKSENGAPEVLLIEETLLDSQLASRYRKLKADLSEILAQAFHNLGVSAAQQGELPTSLEHFATAAKWKPDLPGLDRNWGIVSFRANQYESAIPPLRRQVELHPEDTLARRMLGVSFYITRAFQSVVQTLTPLERRIGSDPELAYIYGVSLMQVAEHKKAGQLFEALAAQNRNNAEARFYSGQGFMMLEDYERALSEFRLAAELDPKMLQVHYNAGQSLIRLNRLSEAEREFRKELELNSADVTAKYHLAYVLLEQKQQVPDALTLLREVVSTHPQYADAQYQLGKTLIDQGEINQAIEHLETAARAEPTKDYIHYQLSIAYRRVSRDADADRELQLYRELKAANRNRQSPMSPGNKVNVP